MSVKFVPLDIQTVAVNAHCVGARWMNLDDDALAHMVAIVAMGYAKAASNLIKKLDDTYSQPPHDFLVKSAIKRLTVSDPSVPGSGVPLYHRDGLIFEIVSWLVAIQQAGPNEIINSPHTSATAQGLDGLSLEMTPGRDGLVSVTVFEDKCSENPGHIFSSDVIKSFLEHHEHKRATELVSVATQLIEQAQVSPQNAVAIAQQVFDRTIRRYRAALAIGPSDDSESARSGIFAKYSKLSDLNADQRVAATFVVNPDVRTWFSQVAGKAVLYLNSLA